jgi:hypothetical protein
MLFADVDLLNTRLPDNGPRYAETDLTRFIREPFNAVTALAFVAIVVVWLVRLRGRYRQHPFLMTCLPILLAGGIGGTLYHGLRRWPAMLALDVVPIVLLVVAGSIYLCIRLWPKRWPIVVACMPLTFLPIPAADALHLKMHTAIIIHYMMLATLILVPVALTLIRTRFRHANLIWLTLTFFGLAILCRYLDPFSAAVLPMGTHWLWHLGGAATTAVLSEYFYRLEREPLAAAEPEAQPAAIP